MEGWWKHLPTSFSVIRDAGGQIAGFYCLFDPADARPMVRRGPTDVGLGRSSAAAAPIQRQDRAFCAALAQPGAR